MGIMRICAAIGAALQIQPVDSPRKAQTSQGASLPRGHRRLPRRLATVHSMSSVCIVAVMLAVAVGATAVECGFYKVFDDNLFNLDRSVLPSVLALIGLKDAR